MEAPGSEGYAEQADALIARYESLSFEQKYRAELDLLPPAPALVLDVGAATGADAAWFASRGHRVIAVEPTAPFRAAGAALHPSPNSEWVDDGLPELKAIVGRKTRFDVILLSAVWMHLDESQRKSGMPVVARLLAPKGLLLMSLRHGPVPAGRRMFEVAAAETVTLAAHCGLEVLLNERTGSIQPENRAAGIEWTRLAFRPG